MNFNYGSVGICQDTRFLLGFGVNDTTTLSNADIARSSNVWYRTAKNRIWSTTGDWEYDDKNASTLPNATTDLVASQADYELPSTAQAVDRVEVMDSDGDYVLMTPINKELVKSEAMTELFSSEGMPQYYDMVGRSIILYPTPNATETTLSSGLRVYVSRDIEEFNATTTTREPGFEKNFHRYISLGNAFDYAIGKGLIDKIANFRNEMNILEKDMEEFYSRRHERSFRPRIRPSTERYI
jgi:hypothetical protein